MIEKKKVLQSMFFMMLIILALCSESNTESLLKVGDKTTINGLNPSHFGQIKLINIDTIENQYLFLIFKPLGGYQYTNYQVKLYKGKQQTSFKSFQAKGINVYVVDKSEIQNGQTLVVSTLCESECLFELSSNWNNAADLLPNKQAQFSFSNSGNAQIFHLDLSDQKFTQVKLLLVPRTKKYSNNDVKIYGKFGYQSGEVSSLFYDFKSVTMWKGTQGIFLQKDEIKNNKILSLMILGSSSSYYFLKTELITDVHHELSIPYITQQYLQTNQLKSFQLNFKNNETNVQVYTFTINQFSGSLDISFFKDESLTQQYNVPKLQYMKDFKYVFLAQKIKNQKISQLFVKISAKDTPSIFLVSFRTETPKALMQLTQNIYDFFAFNKQKLAYLHFEIPQNLEYDEDIEINFNFINILGKCIADFRLCVTESLDKCTNIDLYKNEGITKQLKTQDIGSIGLKSSVKIRISKQEIRSLNQYEKIGVVVISFTNVESQNVLLAMEYTYSNQIQNLRQNHPIEQIVQHQIRFYKYEVLDSRTNGVRLHINKIRGDIETTIYRENPLEKQNNKGQSFAGEQAFINSELDKPIYISVQAQKYAAYGISTHEISSSMKVNPLSISEDIKYAFTIYPNSAQLLKTHPVLNKINVNYIASSTVEACFTNQQFVCLDNLPQINKEGQINAQDFVSQKTYVKIKNPSDKEFVEVSVYYHSKEYSHCQKKQVNNLYSGTSQAGSCFKFPLNSPTQDIQIYCQRIDIGVFQYTVEACGFPLNIRVNSKATIPKELIEQKCANTARSNRYFTMHLTEHPLKPKQHMKLQYIVQNKDDITTLPDGVTYNNQLVNHEGVLKSFYHKLINIKQTTVLLRAINGDFKLYAKIIEEKDRHNTVVSHKSYDFQAVTNNYFKNPTINIQQSQLQNFNCQVCGIVFSIYSSNQIGQPVSFSVQVVQNNIQLLDHIVRQNHLEKDSIDYYQYRSIKDTSDNCNMIVEISDENRNCANIYLSDKQNPSEKNSLVQQRGNKLIYPQCSKKDYYIAVEAVENCPYSISVTNSLFSIEKIKRNVPSNLQLKKDEIKYVLFRHISPTEFKLITLNTYGKVNFFVNELTQTLLNILEKGQIPNFKQFDFSKNNINRLVVKPSQQGFCTNCYYIAVIQAEKDTFSTLVLADENTPIIMTPFKILYDELFNQQQTDVIFRNVLKGALMFAEFNGDIEVLLKYQNRNVSYHLKKSNQLQIFQFQLQNKADYDWSPVQISIQCHSTQCLYSLAILDNTASVFENQQLPIEPGHPTFLTLAESQPHCIKGFFKHEDEDIIVSADKSVSKQLKDLKFDFTSNNQTIPAEQYQVRVVSNTMIISIKDKTMPFDFKLCFSSDSSIQFTIVIEQGQNVNLLPEKIQTIVQEEDTFVIYPEGPFLLDTFDCSPQPLSIKFSEDQQNLNSESIEDENTLNKIPMNNGQSHATGIYTILPTYVRIKSEQSVVRWFKIDEKQEKGMGYIKYGPGKLQYQVTNDSFVVKHQPIKRLSDTNTSISFVQYSLFLSNNVDNLKAAANCGKNFDSTVIKYNIDSQGGTIKDGSYSHQIKKFVIAEKFSNSQKIFITLVADAQIETPKVKDQLDNKQYYRYIYEVQQLSAISIIHPKNNLITIIAVGAAIFVSISLSLFVLLKKVAPFISRLKNRAMIEEDGQQAENDMKREQVIQSNQRIIIDM